MPQPNDSGLRQKPPGKRYVTIYNETQACPELAAAPERSPVPSGRRDAALGPQHPYGRREGCLGFPQSPVDLPLRLDDAGTSPTTPQGLQQQLVNIKKREEQLGSGQSTMRQQEQI